MHSTKPTGFISGVIVKSLDILRTTVLSPERLIPTERRQDAP